MNETLGVRGMGGGEDTSAIFATMLSASVVDIVRRVEPDAAVVMLVMRRSS